MSESESADAPTRVGIACQGGGSHTAFTAGVLRGLLREWDDDRYELVGISGTSGGAFNAVATWYGLVTSDRETTIDLLEELWMDLAADGPAERLVNDWFVGFSRVESSGVPLPRISPYVNPAAEIGRDRIEETLRRHVDFDAIPDLCDREVPQLVVGTVNVNAGEFETFVDEEVTPEAVLASAAVPNLYQAVEIGEARSVSSNRTKAGDDGHLYWDGLFSQNPPIDDLMTVDASRKPEELWIVQINPQRRDGTPRSFEEIADRRNELSGNISLNQELRFIDRVNQWIDEGHLPESDFSKTHVRRIEMDETYHCSTKLDRSPSFIRDLMDMGERQAHAFHERH